jgi:hypothetical protein
MIIENGGGAPQAWAKVDTNNRLHVLSVSEGFNIEAALLGDNFNINSGTVNLTSSNKSAVFHFRNNETKPFVIEAVLAIIGSSTGGSGDFEVEIIQNPTTGTIVDNALAAQTVVNRNFGKTSSTLDADVYKGAEGYTATNGELFADTTRTGAGVIEFDADVMVLPKGSSMGICVTPQTGNTSMNVKIAVVGYLIDTEVTK